MKTAGGIDVSVQALNVDFTKAVALLVQATTDAPTSSTKLDTVPVWLDTSLEKGAIVRCAHAIDQRLARSTVGKPVEAPHVIVNSVWTRW